MITITNKRIAGFVPRWAVFRGFSLLFDNPGNSLTPHGMRLDLTCDVDTDTNLAFYKTLRDSLESLGCDLLTNTYLFCPLPSHSYHVTVWDGGNDANVENAMNPRRQELEEFLARLPNAICHPNMFTEMAATSPLVTNRDWNLRFRFDRLTKWANAVLVGRLAPADEASTNVLNWIIEERSRLTKRFRQTFGIGPSDMYSPHVSLGYFANQEEAQLVSPSIEEWSCLFTERMNGLVLPFCSISVYGFTDMATFFKAARPMPADCEKERG